MYKTDSNTKLALSNIITIKQNFGEDVKSALIGLDGIKEGVEDTLLRSKIASATGTLNALGVSLRYLKRSQRDVQGGDFDRIYQTVMEYISALDSAFAQMAVVEKMLEDQKVTIQIANRLSMIFLTTRRVAGTTLNPKKPNDLISESLSAIEERDRQTNRYLFPSAEMGSDEDDGAGPGVDLNSIRFGE